MYSYMQICCCKGFKALFLQYQKKLIKIWDNYNTFFSSSYLPAVPCYGEIKAKKSFVFSISLWLSVVQIDYSKEIKK